MTSRAGGNSHAGHGATTSASRNINWDLGDVCQLGVRGRGALAAAISLRLGHVDNARDGRDGRSRALGLGGKGTLVKRVSQHHGAGGVAGGSGLDLTGAAAEGIGEGAQVDAGAGLCGFLAQFG